MRGQGRITAWMVLAALVGAVFFAYGAVGPEILTKIRGLAMRRTAPSQALPPLGLFSPAGQGARRERNPKAAELEAKFKDEFSKEFEAQGVAVYDVDDDLNLMLLVYHKLVEIASLDQQAAFLQKVARMWAKYAPGTEVTIKDFKTGAKLGSMKAESEKKVVNPPKEPKKPK